jgi:hypothetical protein
MLVGVEQENFSFSGIELIFGCIQRLPDSRQISVLNTACDIFTHRTTLLSCRVIEIWAIQAQMSMADKNKILIARSNIIKFVNAIII